MSKRYTFARPYKDAYEIVDRDINKALNPEYVVDLLNQQRERIAELEEHLKNAIVPKFKTYQQVYTISKFYTSTNGIPEYEIFNSYYYVAENENEIILGWNYVKDFNQRKYYYVCKDWVFATEEEARIKLEELKGERE